MKSIKLDPEIQHAVSAHQLWQLARDTRAQATAIETAAVRAALVEASWLTGRAALIIGVSHGCFRNMVKRHGLEDEVRKRRLAMTGPRGGRPSDTQVNDPREG